MRTGILFFFLSHLAFASSTLDLRDQGLVTKAKRQSWGTCWAFAAIASMESNILLRRTWSSKGGIDLSEYHMDKYSGFSRNGHENHKNNTSYSGQGAGFIASNTDNPAEGLIVHLGGDLKVAAAYLSNQGGAVEEFKTPGVGSSHDFHDRFGNTKDEGILFKNNYNYYLPDSIEWLSYSDFETNIERIKEAIRVHGSVSSSQHMNNDPWEFSLSGEEIHFYAGHKEPTHAVNIIGWDDYRAVVPFRPGVWVIQDSDHLDEISGHIGYFLTPYGDTHTGQNPEFGGVSFTGVRKRSFKKIHFHSLHGWQYEFEAEKVSNHYELKHEKPVYVGSYTTTPNQSLIAIVKDAKGNIICHTQNKRRKNPGFYLLKFRCDDGEFKDGAYSVELQSSSGVFAYDATKVYRPLLGKSELPEWGEPIKVPAKSNANESFYFKDNEWKDFHYYRFLDEKQYGISINKTGTANFTINLYTIESN